MSQISTLCCCRVESVVATKVAAVRLRYRESEIGGALLKDRESKSEASLIVSLSGGQHKKRCLHVFIGSQIHVPFIGHNL